MIKITNLSVNYNGSLALDNVTLTIEYGERVGLIGRNGAGKTTLLKVISGLIKPTSGQVTFKDKPINKWGDNLFRQLGMVLQNPDHQLFSMSVLDEVSAVLKNYHIEKDASSILEKFGFLDFKERIPFYLSEGEKKKLCLISILSYNPDVLFFDEPFALLDWVERREIYNIIVNLDKTILVTTHDMVLASKFPRLIVLNHGRLVADGSFTDVTPTLKELGYVFEDLF